MNKKYIEKILRIGFVVFMVSALMGPVAVSYAQKQPAEAKDLAALKKRISDLESQIVNMEVMIGTLESLVKQQRGSSTGGAQFSTQVTPSSGGGVSSDRLEVLETQVRAISAQIEQILQSGGSGAGGFSATTLSNGAGKASGGDNYKQQLAALPRDKSASGADAMYNEARSHLLRRDLVAAEKAFKAFVGKHGDTPMAGKAQYWLGEIYFKKRNYRKAADNFLKGYSKYKSGERAADSLFKLALSLQRLGKKGAACKSFSELRDTFPNAPEKLMKRAEREELRLRCHAM